MKDTLVVYHSRSGRTRLVAEALAQRLDADLDEIVTRTAREGVPGYALCALEALAGCTPRLKRTRRDPSRYRRVVIGTPVWVWSLSSPVRSWVRRHPLGSAELAFFCTMGGSGADRAFAQLESACGGAPKARLVLTDAQCEKDIGPALDRFVAALVEQASARGARPAVRRPRPARSAAPRRPGTGTAGSRAGS